MFIPSSISSRTLRAEHGSVSRTRPAEEHAQLVREQAAQRATFPGAQVPESSAGSPCMTVYKQTSLLEWPSHFCAVRFMC